MRKAGFNSGRKSFLVEAPGELVLLPVPDDVVKSLEEWGKPLQHLSLDEVNTTWANASVDGDDLTMPKTRRERRWRWFPPGRDPARP